MGRSRWSGKGQALGYRLSQSIKRVLASETDSQRWSGRAKERMVEIRQEYGWLDANTTVAVQNGNNEVQWWTFGGNRCNATLAREISEETHATIDHDSFTLTFLQAQKLQDVERVVGDLRQRSATEMRPAIDAEAIVGLKFSECLPVELATDMLERRFQDANATRRILDEQIRYLVYD